MKAKWIKDIQYFEELPSTQDYALDLARQGAQGGTLVLAQRQTKGRGRKMNSWFSPAGGLWFSLILRPGMVPLYIPTLNLGMGLAVVRGVKKITGIPASLHWPNDIYCRVGLDDKNGLLNIECDGEKWHSIRSQRLKDSLRDRNLRKEGWSILRLKEKDIVNNLQKCIDRIEKKMEGLGGAVM